MDDILQHFYEKLSAITRNTGTVEEPVIETVLKEVATDDGQITSKVTLQLPAVYYDIANMNYSQAADNIGIADTQVKLKFACRKTDELRWNTIELITKALTGTGSDNFNGIIKVSQKKVEYDDIFVYEIIFSFAYFDISAIPERTQIDKPGLTLNFKIN